MSSPKVLAKLLQSLGSVTSNGATVFTGLHSYKANYILFLLSIAYVDTYTLTEIANVSRCEHLFSLGLIISHLELIWCSKTCRSRLQWQYRRMWNSLSLLQLPSSRFIADPETDWWTWRVLPWGGSKQVKQFFKRWESECIQSAEDRKTGGSSAHLAPRIWWD